MLNGLRLDIAVFILSALSRPDEHEYRTRLCITSCVRATMFIIITIVIARNGAKLRTAGCTTWLPYMAVEQCRTTLQCKQRLWLNRNISRPNVTVGHPVSFGSIRPMSSLHTRSAVQCMATRWFNLDGTRLTAIFYAVLKCPRRIGGRPRSWRAWERVPVWGSRGFVASGVQGQSPMVRGSGGEVPWSWIIFHRKCACFHT